MDLIKWLARVLAPRRPRAPSKTATQHDRALLRRRLSTRLSRHLQRDVGVEDPLD